MADRELPFAGTFTGTGQSLTFSFQGEADLFFSGGIGTVVWQASYDSGSTWINVSSDGSATFELADTDGANVIIYSYSGSLLYRLRCTAYTSGTIAYRVSK